MRLFRKRKPVNPELMLWHYAKVLANEQGTDMAVKRLHQTATSIHFYGQALGITGPQTSDRRGDM